MMAHLQFHTSQKSIFLTTEKILTNIMKFFIINSRIKI
jgi:hypothetical protein